MAKEGAKAKNYCDTESLQTLQSYVLPGHGHPALGFSLAHMSSPSDWLSAGLLLSSPRLKSDPNIGTLLPFLARFTEANVQI